MSVLSWVLADIKSSFGLYRRSRILQNDLLGILIALPLLEVSN